MSRCRSWEFTCRYKRLSSAGPQQSPNISRSVIGGQAESTRRSATSGSTSEDERHGSCAVVLAGERGSFVGESRRRTPHFVGAMGPCRASIRNTGIRSRRATAMATRPRIGIVHRRRPVKRGRHRDPLPRGDGQIASAAPRTCDRSQSRRAGPATGAPGPPGSPDQPSHAAHGEAPSRRVSAPAADVHTLARSLSRRSSSRARSVIVNRWIMSLRLPLRLPASRCGSRFVPLRLKAEAGAGDGSLTLICDCGRFRNSPRDRARTRRRMVPNVKRVIDRHVPPARRLAEQARSIHRLGGAPSADPEVGRVSPRPRCPRRRSSGVLEVAVEIFNSALADDEYP